jgi:hypothetical protein
MVWALVLPAREARSLDKNDFLGVDGVGMGLMEEA